jgi:hypothetical protein
MQFWNATKHQPTCDRAGPVNYVEGGDLFEANLFVDIFCDLRSAAVPFSTFFL